MILRKYDPLVNQYVIFTETKLASGKKKWWVLYTLYQKCNHYFFKEALYGLIYLPELDEASSKII